MNTLYVTVLVQLLNMYVDIDAILDEPGILKLDDPAILDLDDDALLFEDYEEESGQSDQLLAR